MFTVELYRSFLKNSLKNLNNEGIKWLLNEREKIKEVFITINNLFVDDSSILDKKDKSIYTLIKREALYMLEKNINNFESTYAEIKYFINSILSEIDSLINSELLSA